MGKRTVPVDIKHDCFAVVLGWPSVGFQVDGLAELLDWQGDHVGLWVVVLPGVARKFRHVLDFRLTVVV